MKNLIEIYEKYTFCSDIFLFLENKKSETNSSTNILQYSEVDEEQLSN
jgi:hypothetical protein